MAMDKNVDFELFKAVHQNYGNLICIDSYQRFEDKYEVILNYVAPVVINRDELRSNRLEFMRINGIGKLILNNNFAILDKTSRPEINARIDELSENLIKRIELHLIAKSKMNLAQLTHLKNIFNPTRVIIDNIIDNRKFILPDKKAYPREYIKYLKFCQYLEEFEIITKESLGYHAGNFLVNALDTCGYEKSLELSFAEFLYQGEIKYKLITSNYRILINVLDLIYYLTMLSEDIIGLNYSTVRNLLANNFGISRSARFIYSRYISNLREIDLIDIKDEQCYAKKEIVDSLIELIPKNNLLNIQATF